MRRFANADGSRGSSRRRSRTSLALFDVALFAFRPNGAATYQPGATPPDQRGEIHVPSPERAPQIRRSTRVGLSCRALSGLRRLVAIMGSQGVALGWYVAAPLGRRKNRATSKLALRASGKASEAPLSRAASEVFPRSCGGAHCQRRRMPAGRSQAASACLELINLQKSVRDGNFAFRVRRAFPNDA
jgi:hypothetical protein